MTDGVTTIDQLRPGSKGNNLIVKVIDAKVVVDRPKGSKGGSTKISECIVGDSTASIIFSARDEQIDIAQPGSFVSLLNANVEMQRGTMRLVLDKAGKIENAGDVSFKPAVGNNISLIEFEVVTAPTVGGNMP
ncbi:hypothetical protein CEUSTIGMA_g8953.t1 [Chlamydomonas eustigma]|uniref:Single-stranded DNA binding protein Ssb-like OB fold domain-containing protein n=1 Tax=Chlamydomonas eustigma TaxID=1157962 RepID=A0A250XEM6_9CHLO|nr:hypothetical protein CEUSTIGMA_g8953.t1 [Chlamydomonas eustigma]|eukprot:GAX81525.1 hypothetical protein CEUSTIGMA_g8953.t1 [Chlamydomonas eustigma]